MADLADGPSTTTVDAFWQTDVPAFSTPDPIEQPQGMSAGMQDLFAKQTRFSELDGLSYDEMTPEERQERRLLKPHIRLLERFKHPEVDSSLPFEQRRAMEIATGQLPLEDYYKAAQLSDAAADLAPDDPKRLDIERKLQFEMTAIDAAEELLTGDREKFLASGIEDPEYFVRNPNAVAQGPRDDTLGKQVLNRFGAAMHGLSEVPANMMHHWAAAGGRLNEKIGQAMGNSQFARDMASFSNEAIHDIQEEERVRMLEEKELGLEGPQEYRQTMHSAEYLASAPLAVTPAAPLVLPIVATQVGTNTYSEARTAAADAGVTGAEAEKYAALSGGSAAILTYLGGRLLGTVAGRLSGNISNTAIGKTVDYATKKAGLSQALSSLLGAAGGVTGEVVEEHAQAVTQAYLDEFYKVNPEAVDEYVGGFWKTTRMAAMGGLVGEAVVAAARRTAESFPEAAKAFADAEVYRDGKVHQGDVVFETPIPIGRKGFEEATGIKNTTREYREAFSEATLLLEGPTSPPAEGYVRMYHGGVDSGSKGSRDFSPDYDYAKGYADKSEKGQVYYVDLPLNSPHLRKAFDDTGTGTPAPYINTTLPESIASGRRLFRKSETEDSNPDISFDPTEFDPDFAAQEKQRAAEEKKRHKKIRGRAERAAKHMEGDEWGNIASSRLKEIAETDPDAADDILGFATELYEFHRAAARDMKSEFMDVVGSAETLSWLRNKVRSAIRGGGDAGKIPGFDVLLERMRTEAPHLLHEAGDAAANDGEAALVDLILTPAEELYGEPRRWDYLGQAMDELDPANRVEAEAAGHEPSDYAAYGFGVSPNLSLLSKLPRHLASVKKWLKRSFGTRGGAMGTEMHDLIEAQAGEVAKHTRRLRYNEADLRRAMRASGIGVNPDPVTRKSMDDVLKGGDAPLLSTEVKAALRSMRAHVDALSRELISSGAIDQDSELAATVEENMGVYINRTYRKHHDKTWMDTALSDPELREDGLNFLAEQYPESSEEELAARLELLLSPHLDSAGIPDSIARDRQFMGILRQRKNLPDVLKRLYGEYRDPFVNYSNTVSKMATLVSSHRMGEQMRSHGLESGLLAEPDALRPGMYAAIDGQSNPMLRSLDGMLTSPEVKEALEGEFGPDVVGPMMRRYLRAVGYTKAAKTVFALPRGAIRNFLGNPLIALQAGNSPFGGFKQIPRLKKILLDQGNTSERRFMERMAEMGIIGEELRTAEIKDLLRAAEEADPFNADQSVTEITIRRAAKKSGDFYQLQDAAWKIEGFLRYQEQYAEAYPNKSEREIERLASNLIRDLYPTYSRAKDIAKAISRTPLIGDFALFQAEMIRTQINAFRIGQAEVREGIRTNNPKLRALGAKKLAGASIAPLAMSALAKASMWLFGVDEQEDEDRRLFRPPWNENADIVYSGDAVDGEPGQFDLGYMNPYSYQNKAFRAFFRADSTIEGLRDAGLEAGAAFYEGGMLTSALAEVWNGHYADGRPLYSEAATEKEKAKAMADHLASAFKPGFVDSAERITKAAEGQVSPSTGKQYSLAEELIAAVLTRSANQNIEISLSFRNGEHLGKIRAAEADIRSAVRKTNNYSIDELKAFYLQREQVRRETWEKWSETYMAAIRLGVDEADADTMVADAFGKSAAQRLKAGEYVPYLPGKQSLETLAQEYGQDRVDALLDAHQSLLND